MSGQATVIGFCGPPGSIALPAGLRWLRMAIRLALCVLCALTLGTAWAQSGGGGNANGGAMLSATQPIPAGTAAAAGATPSAGAAAAAHPWLTAAHVIVMPWVTVLLLVAGCLLLFHDLLTPLTWGATGTGGVTLIGLVFAANLTDHSRGWIGVLLLLVGLALLLAEIHIYPGHGLAAIGGLLFLFLGMFLALGGMRNAGFSLSVSGVLTVVALLSFFAYLPKSPVWKQIGREMRQRAVLAHGVGETHATFLGQRGVVLTGLRPAGVAEIGGVKLEVVTEGDFLSAGTPVVVSQVEGRRVVVESVSAVAAEQELRQATLG